MIFKYKELPSSNAKLTIAYGAKVVEIQEIMADILAKPFYIQETAAHD